MRSGYAQIVSGSGVHPPAIDERALPLFAGADNPLRAEPQDVVALLDFMEEEY